MTINDPAESHAPLHSQALAGDIAAVMAHADLARFHLAGAPVIMAAGAPPRVVYASAAACTLLGTSNPEALAVRLFAAGDCGRRRLSEMAARTHASPPRLERIRLPLAAGAETLTLQCRQMPLANGGWLFVMVALGVRAALLRRAVPHEVPAASPLQPDAHPTMAEITAANAPADIGLPAPTELRADFMAARNAGRALRFSWRSDAHDRLVEFPPLVLQAAGIAPDEVPGLSWHELTARLALDAQGRLAAALAARSTFSGLETRWPMAQSGEILPVTLGAAPVTDADHVFEGYRGFGLIHFDRISAPAPMVWTEATVDAPDDVTTEELQAPAAHEAPAADEAPAAHEAPAADEAPAAYEAPAAQEPPAPAQPEQNNPVKVPTDHAGSRLAETVAAAAPSGVPHAVPASDAPDKLKVVRLRPLQGHLKLASQTEARPGKPVAPPAIADASPPEAGRGPGAASGLSSSERQAFSEIARSLAEKVKNKAPEIFASETPASEILTSETLTSETLTSETSGPEILAPVSAFAAPEAEGDLAALPPVSADVRHDTAHNLLQRLPLGVLVSRDGEALFASQHLLDILGYEDETAFRLIGGFHRMFKGRQPESFEPGPDGAAIPLVNSVGDIVMAEARLQTVDWEGAPASLLTLRRAPDHDVNARLRTLETELRQQEMQARELHAILDTATDGVAILDEAGRILSLNRSAEALFGHEQNEVAGEMFTTLFAPDQQHSAKDYFDGIKTNGVASVLNDGREMLGRARQGGAIPLFMTIGRVGPGSNPKFCLILRDLTQWKKVEGELGDARREAERASQLKSEFLAKISHEIRTPLNAILGFAEVMSEERLGPIGIERYKEYVHDIHASGQHVMSLVNDLLDLSKIEAGKMELEFSSVDANKVVGECVSMMHPQAARDRVVMRLSLAPRLPNIVADERSLRQIVLNLLSNAVKFNEPGGQVIISTALTDAGHAVIRIRDTGIGMTDLDVAAAMEPFKQLATSRGKTGTGLGLPLTKALVEANRAAFTIKSKKLEGTLVEVAFPPTRVLAE